MTWSLCIFTASLAFTANCLRAAEQPSASGIYPHLAMFNEEGECGTGAVVPWRESILQRSKRIAIDDENAELHGKWESSGNLTGFVGGNYRYSSDAKATARFPFTVKEAGAYDVRVAWQPHANRAQAATVTVQSAGGEKTLTLDQTKPVSGANGFQSLGKFRFTTNEKDAVLCRVAGAKGTTHIDAVQVVPAK